MAVLGTPSLGPEGASRFTKIVADMKAIYSQTAKLALNAQQVRMLKDEPKPPADYPQMVEDWKSFNMGGQKVLPLYKEYLDFTSKIAKASSYGKYQFSDLGQVWRSDWEIDDLQEQLAAANTEIEPLYQLVHAYIRMNLRKVYGEVMPKDGTIPAPLMSSALWKKYAFPYPDAPSFDITPVLRANNVTALKMFKTSEDFFVSLGLEPMSETFWRESMFVKPAHSVVCHASAYDMSDPTSKDYRIKMCADVSMRDFITVHHEMGHIVYYMLYSKQPYIFQDGANSGFHEAVGDTIALCVSSPKHLEKLGLPAAKSFDPEIDKKRQINFLMEQAWSKVMSSPFSYQIDYWRYRVFSGEIARDEMNKKWWDITIKFRGVSPPVLRSEENFDPGTIFHICANVPYDRYFVAKVLQYSFYDSFCGVAGEKQDFNCDFYGSKTVGELMKTVFSLGSSEPWPGQLKSLTGSEKLSPSAMLNYFEPLRQFLEEELRKNGETPGWESATVDTYLT